MSTFVTLAERECRAQSAMRVALEVLDCTVAAYARERGGRFIRFGSTVTGPMHARSDVDLIADFADDRAASSACRFVDDLCQTLDLQADVRPSQWVSERVMARALARGLVLR